MLFVDYIIEKAGDNIAFDKELNPAHLDVKPNDMFRAVIDENNRLMFIKTTDESK